MGSLPHCMGALLPEWLVGQELIRESRQIEQRCWRELGYAKQPIFDGDLPAFLMEDGVGQPCDLSLPTEPVKLAARMVNLAASSLPTSSPIGANLDTLARLLNFTPFESQWLLWSCCVWHFGRAILPVITLRHVTHGCDVLALLADMPVGAVQDAVASRRLYAWGFLDGIGAEGEMPPLLSGWLSASDKFADWAEHPYASDSDLSKALCQAQVSLPASR
ncbi:hypothetical protein [Acidovorax radicis]|jgi:hypothetical protein|uniref:hypothetical protein n=1 Tax=Acidovorax radicis TaxID=758826 RepID=UPI001CFB6211|nr:hypothetical protein [Acidovorax radicis]UCV01013.1 hypothetical protein KI609_09900 [Acidovorax radicis]